MDWGSCEKQVFSEPSSPHDAAVDSSLLRVWTHSRRLADARVAEARKSEARILNYVVRVVAAVFVCDFCLHLYVKLVVDSFRPISLSCWLGLDLGFP